MKCPNCGAEIKKHQKECEYCKTNLENNIEKQVLNDISIERSIQRFNQTNTSKSALFIELISLSIFMIMPIIFIVIFFTTAPKDFMGGLMLPFILVPSVMEIIAITVFVNVIRGYIKNKKNNKK